MSACDSDVAIARAGEFLREQAEAGFPGTRHAMRFPRRAGFLTTAEEHASDGFARAVIAGVLLDVAEREADPDRRASWRRIARREAERVATAKLSDLAGGWSYFPTLPELPPDLDSLAAALALFARIAPEFLPLCDGPLDHARALDGGGWETWIVAETDPPGPRKAMARGIARHWGRGADVDVVARFALALALADPRRHAEAIGRGARFVADRQRPDGGWDASWYWGQAQAADLALRLLLASRIDPEAQARAIGFLLRSQRPDGGWGVWETVPTDTALALGVLAEVGPPAVPAESLARGVAALLDLQTLGGFWKGTPWIKMDVGRSSGRVDRTITHGNATVTTAFAMRSLLAASGTSATRSP